MATARRERPFFKIWAAKALLSGDLAALTDHERSVWIYLLCVASLEEPRWRVPINAHLARQCFTTPKRLDEALAHMAALGMVVLEDGVVFMATAAKLNEETERKPKPSDAPERVLERVTRHRKAAVTPDVTPSVTRSNAAHKEEEKEEEEEEERNASVTADDDGLANALPVAVREMRDSLVLKLPGKFQRDPLAFEEMEAFAVANVERPADVEAAVAAVRRSGGICFAANLWRQMPDFEPLPAAATRSPEPIRDGSWLQEHVVPPRATPEEMAQLDADYEATRAARKAELASLGVVAE